MTKAYLVVGDSQGIGNAVARALMERGDYVVGISRSKAFHTWDHLTLDAVDFDASMGSIVSDYLVEKEIDQFDGIIFCHAKHGDKGGAQWDSYRWTDYFEVNCTSIVRIVDLLDNVLSDTAKIVLFGSFLQNGSANQPAYAASKAALWAWMRSYTMRQDGTDQRAVNMIWPGRVNTPSNIKRELPKGEPNQFREPEEIAVATLQLLDDTLGRRGTTIDLGRS